MAPFDYSRVVYTKDKKLRTADVLALVPGEAGWDVLLVVRGTEPFLGEYSLPGGFLEKNEDAGPGQAAARELEEETGLAVKEPEDGFEERAPEQLERGRLAWLSAYDEEGRDPRFDTHSDAYIVLLDHKPAVEGGDDAARAEFMSFDELLERIDAGERVLGFDHDQYLRDAREFLARFGVTPPA